MNILFEYLYRDAGNNKKWGDVIFSNKKNINVDTLNRKIRDILIDGEFFIAKKSQLPVIKTHNRVNELDHDWYEFHLVKQTDEEPNEALGRDIVDFLSILKTASEV